MTSTSNTNGAQTSSQLYYPYGDKRGATRVVTPYQYTGQRWEDAIGLTFYNARWYDPALGRFIQPDSIVPEPGNPQDLNRYTYARNNPVLYADPDGHNPLLGLMLIAAGGAALYVQHQQARAYAQAHDMTVWQAYCDPDFRTDEAAKVDAAIKGAFVVAATAIGVEAALSLGAATLMELGMQYDPSGQLFAKGLALNGLAARWDAFLLGQQPGVALPSGGGPKISTAADPNRTHHIMYGSGGKHVAGWQKVLGEQWTGNEAQDYALLESYFQRIMAGKGTPISPDGLPVYQFEGAINGYKVIVRAYETEGILKITDAFVKW